MKIKITKVNKYLPKGTKPPYEISNLTLLSEHEILDLPMPTVTARGVWVMGAKGYPVFIPKRFGNVEYKIL